MNTELINNHELEKYAAMNPDASFRDVVEYFKEIINEELDRFIDQDTEKEMYVDFDEGYGRRLSDYIMEGNGFTTARQDLESAVYYQYSNTRNKVEEMLHEHGKKFGEKLKQFTEKQLDELADSKIGEEEAIRIENGLIVKEDQLEEDRNETIRLENNAMEFKENVKDAFRKIEQDPEKIYEFEYVLRSSDDIFQENLFNKLRSQDDRVFEEYSMIRDYYLKAIEEAAHLYAKENKLEQDEIKQEEVQKDEIEQDYPEIDSKPHYLGGDIEQGKDAFADVVNGMDYDLGFRKEEVKKATTIMKKEKEQEREGESKTSSYLSIDDIY